MDPTETLMQQEPVIQQIRYLPILVAGTVAFLIGVMWYTMLFGKTIADIHGFTKNEIEEFKANAPRTLAVMLLCFLVAAFGFAYLAKTSYVTSGGDGMLMGFLIWAGIAVPIGLTSLVTSNKPTTLFLIDTGYHLAFLCVMGLILGGWQ